MSKYYVCCGKCFEFIESHSAMAAGVWLDLCAILTQIDLTDNRVIMAKINDFPELRLLEKMGFVTTTDTNQFILIKMNGYQPDEDCFCLKGGEHE